MRKATAIFSIIVALSSGSRLLAHEGHEHKVMGTVAAIDAKHIEVTTKEEQTTTLWLDEETRYFRGKSKTTAGDVKVGERIAVKAIEKEGRMVAREVRLADLSK